MIVRSLKIVALAFLVTFSSAFAGDGIDGSDLVSGLIGYSIGQSSNNGQIRQLKGELADAEQANARLAKRVQAAEQQKAWSQSELDNYNRKVQIFFTRYVGRLLGGTATDKDVDALEKLAPSDTQIANALDGYFKDNGNVLVDTLKSSPGTRRQLKELNATWDTLLRRDNLSESPTAKLLYRILLMSLFETRVQQTIGKQDRYPLQLIQGRMAAHLPEITAALDAATVHYAGSNASYLVKLFENFWLIYLQIKNVSPQVVDSYDVVLEIKNQYLNESFSDLPREMLSLSAQSADRRAHDLYFESLKIDRSLRKLPLKWGVVLYTTGLVVLGTGLEIVSGGLDSIYWMLNNGIENVVPQYSLVRYGLTTAFENTEALKAVTDVTRAVPDHAADSVLGTMIAGTTIAIVHKIDAMISNIYTRLRSTAKMVQSRINRNEVDREKKEIIGRIGEIKSDIEKATKTFDPLQCSSFFIF